MQQQQRNGVVYTVGALCCIVLGDALAAGAATGEAVHAWDVSAPDGAVVPLGVVMAGLTPEQPEQPADAAQPEPPPEPQPPERPQRPQPGESHKRRRGPDDQAGGRPSGRAWPPCSASSS